MILINTNESSSTLSKKILLRVSPQHMTLFRFLLEAYDNLAHFTVLDKEQALLKVFFSLHQEQDVYTALKDINDALPIIIYPWPEG